MIKTPCAGIHLSGPNSSKTALVVLRPLRGPSANDETTGLELVRVYEKIGSFGNLFSDDRLFGILTREGPFQSVFVDCPLTVPPCVDCARPSCPGVVRCDDVGVAWMMAVAARQGASKQRKRKKVNPQGHRLWDVFQTSVAGVTNQEPTWSSNHAPLVVRARTLQRRLNSVDQIKLEETHVPCVVDILARELRIDTGGNRASIVYRSFENGKRFRGDLVRSMVRAGLVADNSHPDLSSGILYSSVEVFHAFVTAWVAGMFATGNTVRPTDGFVDAGGGWVHLPEIGVLPNPR